MNAAASKQSCHSAASRTAENALCRLWRLRARSVHALEPSRAVLNSRLIADIQPWRVKGCIRPRQSAFRKADATQGVDCPVNRCFIAGQVLVVQPDLRNPHQVLGFLCDGFTDEGFSVCGMRTTILHAAVTMRLRPPNFAAYRAESARSRSCSMVSLFRYSLTPTDTVKVKPSCN